MIARTYFFNFPINQHQIDYENGQILRPLFVSKKKQIDADWIDYDRHGLFRLLR